MRVQGYKRLGRSQWLRCATCGEKTKQDQTSRNEHEASPKHLQALQAQTQDTTRLSASSEPTQDAVSPDMRAGVREALGADAEAKIYAATLDLAQRGRYQATDAEIAANLIKLGWQPAPQWAKDAKDQDAVLAQAEQCADCHAPTEETCICDDLNHAVSGDPWESKSWTEPKVYTGPILTQSAASDAITDEQYRAAARRIHQRDGEVEIDEGATVSRGDDPGCYVAAWVWVYDEDVTEAQGGAA
jgi:hypothetical protein